MARCIICGSQLTRAENNHDRMYLCPNTEGGPWCMCPVISVKVRKGVPVWSIVVLEAQPKAYRTPYVEGWARFLVARRVE